MWLRISYQQSKISHTVLFLFTFSGCIVNMGSVSGIRAVSQRVRLFINLKQKVCKLLCSLKLISLHKIRRCRKIIPWMQCLGTFRIFDRRLLNKTYPRMWNPVVHQFCHINDALYQIPTSTFKTYPSINPKCGFRDFCCLTHRPLGYFTVFDP